jgi:hypothetical protein
VSASRVALFATAALSLLIATAVPGPGYAQDDLRAKGARFCNGDARRLCKDVLGQGDMIVLACFQEHKARLSSGCRKFLIEVGQLQ